MSAGEVLGSSRAISGTALNTSMNRGPTACLDRVAVLDQCHIQHHTPALCRSASIMLLAVWGGGCSHFPASSWCWVNHELPAQMPGRDSTLFSEHCEAVCCGLSCTGPVTFLMGFCWGLSSLSSLQAAAVASTVWTA